MIYLLIVSTNSVEGNTKWIVPTFNFSTVRPNSCLSTEKTGPLMNPSHTLQVVVNMPCIILCMWPKTVDGRYYWQGNPTENIFWPVNQLLKAIINWSLNIIPIGFTNGCGFVISDKVKCL